MTAELKSRFHSRTQPGKWRYVLENDLVCHLGHLGLRHTHQFLHAGTSKGKLEGALLTIFAGYAIDGCSPAIAIRGKRIGTPTPPATKPAAFVHDFLYQFMDLPCCPWNREQADAIFYDLLRSREFPFALTYGIAVTLFGGITRKLTPRDSRAIACLTHL